VCDSTNSRVWHDSFTCVAWLLHRSILVFSHEVEAEEGLSQHWGCHYIHQHGRPCFASCARAHTHHSQVMKNSILIQMSTPQSQLNLSPPPPSLLKHAHIVAHFPRCVCVCGMWECLYVNRYTCTFECVRACVRIYM
jgi:hypothetical protein